uniref:Uncharacterized protein n=1 Tax=Arundo donax TaxID=35708 RepID=A0A0A8YKQ0_ARUDO
MSISFLCFVMSYNCCPRCPPNLPRR